MSIISIRILLSECHPGAAGILFGVEHKLPWLSPEKARQKQSFVSLAGCNFAKLQDCGSVAARNNSSSCILRGEK